jgi:hypothetical protein
MKFNYGRIFGWISIVLIVVIALTAVGCGEEESPEATPTPTSSPTATASPEPTGETGTLSGLEGDVQVLRAGASEWEAATSGMNVGEGYGVKTGSDGYVVITFFEGSVMEVEADTEISIEELSGTSGGSTIVRISQAIGDTVNTVQYLTDSSSTYAVETPAGTAVARGTIYKVSVSVGGKLTCTETFDENDEGNHYVNFTGGGVTVNVLEKMTSCCWVGGIPGSPFYTDPADDPNQGGSGGGGGYGYGYPQPTPTPTPTPTSMPN